MPRSKKTPEPVAAAPSTTTKTSKKVSSAKRSSKKETTAAPTPAETPVNEVVDATTAVDPDPEDSSTALAAEFTLVLTQIQTLAQQLSVVKTSLRTLEKKAVRELKAANKANKKNKRAKGNRQPSGFVKPTLISDELASFLGKDKGTEMARTAVTKEINSYIREHSLQDPKNGRRILPDTALRSLLNIQSNEELTYFNLQKFMSPHFAKASTSKSA